MPEKTSARKVADEEERVNLKIDLRTDDNNFPGRPYSVEKNYLRRKAEVTKQDHKEFLLYEQEKARRTAPAQAERRSTDETGSQSAKVNRRNFLTVVAGTAAVGEAAALGYSIVKDQTIPAHGARQRRRHLHRSPAS